MAQETSRRKTSEARQAREFAIANLDRETGFTAEARAALGRTADGSG
jgi:hypothetical protein